jgi:AAHS family 4-hydroxybenzoate transporter-like MFS transporter
MTIDVREEIAVAPLRRYHVFLAALIALVVFFDGYDNFNPSYVIHYVAEPWHLRQGQAGLLVSSGLFGFMISALAQGAISDRYGRRTSVLIGLWIATIFSLATALFANSFLTFCVFRLFTGLGLGVLLPVSVTYMNEVAPRSVRQTFSTWGWTLGFIGGAVAASIVGVFLTPRFGWPVLFYLGSLSVVLAVACHFLLPETPQCSAMRGNMRDVARVLARLNPSRAAAYEAPGVTFALGEPSDRMASVPLLLSPRYRMISLPLWFSAIFVLYGVYGITGWIPTVMMQRGETFAASFSYGALIMGSSFFGTLACGYLADRLGRGREILTIWWCAGAICITVLALVNLHWLNVLCLAGAGFFIVGAQGGLNNFTAGLYDTEIRGTAVGFMLGFGRIGAVLGPYISGLLQQAIPGSSVLFASLGLAVLFGALSVLFVRSGRTDNAGHALVPGPATAG